MSETNTSSPPVVTDLLAARRATWEAGAVKASRFQSKPSAPDDAELAMLQSEATERALRNWDQDELAEISGPQGGASLEHSLVVALFDAADDFTRQRLTPPTDYAEYLQSDRWKEIRRRKLLRCGGICQRCSRSWRDYGFLDVHHLDYRRFGAEREADLIVLCRQCHNAEHGITA